MIHELCFPGVVPGNNGPKGLLRMNFRVKTKLLTTYQWQVKAAKVPRLAGPVRLELIRHSTGRPMDYDNLVSTGKLLVDAIVRAGVLPDDTPAVIAQRDYTQVRATTSAAQKTIIRLTNL